MTRRPSGEPSSREHGLRWLAKSRDRPEVNIQHALEQPYDPAKSVNRMKALRALVAGLDTAPATTTAEQRARALWRLIQEELGRIGLPEGHKRRTALKAALHLDPANTATTLDRRLIYARDQGHFGSKQYGYDRLRKWWGGGVRQLGHAVDHRLANLCEHPEQWQRYFKEEDQKRPVRPLSQGAQPVFLNLLLTTVFMRGRAPRRRVAERLVTAQRDNVDHYLARAWPGPPGIEPTVRVNAIWNCRAEPLPFTPRGPVLSRLYFPQALGEGEQHYFSSEIVSDDVADERPYVNVEVDHFGIAAGRLTPDGIPIAGLTIRIKFQEGNFPEAAWWYAEVTETERFNRPPDGDPRRLHWTSQGCLQHTFTQSCEPRENYGVAWVWPADI